MSANLADFSWTELHFGLVFLATGGGLSQRLKAGLAGHRVHPRA